MRTAIKSLTAPQANDLAFDLDVLTARSMQLDPFSLDSPASAEGQEISCHPGAGTGRRDQCCGRNGDQRTEHQHAARVRDHVPAPA